MVESFRRQPEQVWKAACPALEELPKTRAKGDTFVTMHTEPSPPRAAEPSPALATPEAQLEALRQLMRDLGSVLVCYSGGIDSALVLAVAHEQLGPNAIGMTAVSPSLAPAEREDAARLARSMGARHELIDSHEIERPGYVANGPDRCFHCKSELYDIARQRLAQLGFAHILNGTNSDDLGDYRPGLEAAKSEIGRAHV